MMIRRKAYDAVKDVVDERERQRQEVATPEQDMAYIRHELPRAAACYAAPLYMDRQDGTPVGWPWPPMAWNPSDESDRRRDMVKAAALLLAEIERIDRMREGE